MREYKIIFYDMTEAARFVEYLEKNKLYGTLTYQGASSDARSFLGILSHGFIGKYLTLFMAEGQDMFLKTFPAAKMQ